MSRCYRLTLIQWFYLYNIGCTVECSTDYIFTAYLELLSEPDVQEQLHVKPGSFYASPSGIVASSMNSDVSKSVIQLMPSLLSSMPVLLYQGSEDYIVNVAGVDAWINSCQWSGLPEWQQQRPRRCSIGWG